MKLEAIDVLRVAGKAQDDKGNLGWLANPFLGGDRTQERDVTMS
jgi:hypothetical protein